jgi:hypothetical protein
MVTEIDVCRLRLGGAMTVDLQLAEIATAVQSRLTSVGIECSVWDGVEAMAFGVRNLANVNLDVRDGTARVALSREDESSIWCAIDRGNMSVVELWPLSDSATLVELLVVLLVGPVDVWRGIFGRRKGVKVSLKGRVWRLASRPTF